MVSIQSNHKQIYCLVTIDGDLRVGDYQQKMDGVVAIRSIHAELGLTGQTTWFINEYDFEWTVHFSDILLELSAENEMIGVHDHQDTHFADTYESAFELMKIAKDRLSQFYNRQGIDQPLIAHRNGCALQTTVYYQAAIDLGYQIVSEVRPSELWYARMVQQENGWYCLGEEDEGALLVDNRTIPPGVIPWYHDAENWLDYSSKRGRLLQLPITSMPWIDREQVEVCVAYGREKAFLVFDTHPYDLLDQDTGKVSAQRMKKYRDDLIWLTETYQPKFLQACQVKNII